MDRESNRAAAGGGDAQQLKSEPRAVHATAPACTETGAAKARPPVLCAPRRGGAALVVGG